MALTVHHDIQKSGQGRLQHGTIEPGGYTFIAEIYVLPSPVSIDGGRIAQLHITDSAERSVVSYNRGFAPAAPGLSDEQKGLIAAMQTAFPVGKDWPLEQWPGLEAGKRAGEQMEARLFKELES